MHANSNPVASPQTGPHHRLAALVRKHQAQPFLKPPAPYSNAAYQRFLAARAPCQAVILDACCGTGESSLMLARRHPQHLVVGVDQSAQRLARGLAQPGPPPNLLLLRADMVDFWRLLAAAGVVLAAHYLLYPNPWPKPAQLMRRWPAHPVFPTIVALGGQLECRSNWRVYAEEFAAALRLVSGRAPTFEIIAAAQGLSPFERKYHQSGHTLYRVAADLGAGGTSSRAET